MFRPGRNPKTDQPHTDDTADHTPQTPSSSYGSSGNAVGSPSSAAAGGPSASSASASDLYQSGVQTPTTTRAVTESESLARDIKEGTLSGFVGNGTTLTGEASFKGMLRVDGHLSGRVQSSDGTLIVSTNGQVDANVEVAVAQIFGTVNGDITASKRIEMGRVAKVNGNIETPALVIENGALFEGSCRMVQLKETQDKGRAKESSTAASTSGTATSSGASTGASSGASSSTTSSSAYGGGSAASAARESKSDSAEIKNASDIAS